jgi:hypothetical protein
MAGGGLVNTAKKTSDIDGRKFMREALTAEQQVLLVKFDLSSKSITHSGVMGEVNEQHFIEVLRRYLPKRYAVDQGIVVDCNGNTSDQIDVVVFDRQYTPTLLDQHSHRFIPAEAVYCVLEAKPNLSKQYLEYAATKAESVRRLERTSVPITHAGGEYPAKPPFEVIAGIVAVSADWAEGCASPALAEALAKLTRERKIDCGLALADRSFDTYDGELYLSDLSGSLAVFLFRLLHRLQSLGTVPAVDWNRYGDAFGSPQKP